MTKLFNTPGHFSQVLTHFRLGVHPVFPKEDWDFYKPFAQEPADFFERTYLATSAAECLLFYLLPDPVPLHHRKLLWQFHTGGLFAKPEGETRQVILVLVAEGLWWSERVEKLQDWPLLLVGQQGLSFLHGKFRNNRLNFRLSKAGPAIFHYPTWANADSFGPADVRRLLLILLSRLEVLLMQGGKLLTWRELLQTYAPWPKTKAIERSLQKNIYHTVAILLPHMPFQLFFGIALRCDGLALVYQTDTKLGQRFHQAAQKFLKNFSRSEHLQKLLF